MDEKQRRVDEVRRESTELENHLIDEYVNRKISRKELMRRGTAVGMSIPVLSFIAAACGGDDDDDGASQTGGGETTAGAVQPGGTVRVALIQPTTEPNPLLVQDEGGAGMLGATGEYLSFSDENLELQPRLAESWEPNDDGSVWTFKIRSGVTFHNGAPMTSEDVVATFEKLINPDGGSANAQSALGGVLSAGNMEAPDETTVVFNLDAPNGNFPTLVSSANYNAIIIPADLDPADWGQTFEGTGPFKLQSFTPQQGATFVRNDAYWGDKANPDTVDVKFYAEEAPMIVALQGDEVDFVEHFSVAGGKALLDNPDVQVIAIQTATHRQLHMRTDKEPFTDARVRQAIALAIDRNALVDGLWEGLADIGNDSPFAPVYPSTDTSVPQREQDIEQAKQLLADAGAEGFTVQLDTWDGFEIPDLAQLVKSAAAEIGVTINLNITDAGTYYGDGVYGKSPWLDSVMGITDYGHRPVPNVYLTAALAGDPKLGVWNSAHFKNDDYDELVRQYVAALDVETQKGVAKQIQELLLEETPIIFPYFYNFLSAAKPNLQGAVSAATGQFDLSKAGFTA
ncbi:MAG TPA: ABC transporter substrate-binding protein [Gaiellaceae bacterium]|jgi:peptide/nickel transport system substrate-binding protein|nr:ABC transporter substrate-binding protein [Gaiellaceae bacterium]